MKELAISTKINYYRKHLEQNKEGHRLITTISKKLIKGNK